MQSKEKVRRLSIIDEEEVEESVMIPLAGYYHKLTTRKNTVKAQDKNTL